jgi:ATP-dependent DNA helicase RecG
LQDLAKNHPMSRLLEGDVGSGKTVVAAIGMLDAAKNGYQAVLMAPTEILAKQHFVTISRFLANNDVKISLITRSEKMRNWELGIGNSNKKFDSKFLILNSDIIIGTQALIQEKIEFKNLALAIVDEQHRFGVRQRKELQHKSGNQEIMPHFLSMTATPIPRSLALTLYGDLDLSIIDELPSGRKKIVTKVVAKGERVEAYDFIRQEIQSGRQVFFICPLIDPSDKLGVRSVKEEFERLNKEIFPEIPTGFLHGRIKPQEKEKIMQGFLQNKIKILVSTSVVEVGVDVPNASVMMVEGAERFGLAQLHQFRGRVGRSEYQSYCFLLTDSDSEIVKERLLALVESNDGFKLAEKDLRFRGPGEVFGTAQSGMPDLKLANLFDFVLIKQAREWVNNILKIDPDLNRYPALKAKLGELEAAHLE